MTAFVDLALAAHEAFFATLDSGIDHDMAAVFAVVPQDTQPPFILIGAIDSENEAEEGDQLEKLTVEVQYIYRGNDRRKLLAMMHAGRVLLDDQILAGPEGVAFSKPKFVSASVSSAGPDGVTFAGIQNFTLWAQPVT